MSRPSPPSKDSLQKMPLGKLIFFAYVISRKRSANQQKQLHNDASSQQVASKKLAEGSSVVHCQWCTAVSPLRCVQIVWQITYYIFLKLILLKKETSTKEPVLIHQYCFRVENLFLHNEILNVVGPHFPATVNGLKLTVKSKYCRTRWFTVHCYWFKAKTVLKIQYIWKCSFFFFCFLLCVYEVWRKYTIISQPSPTGTRKQQIIDSYLNRFVTL